MTASGFNSRVSACFACLSKCSWAGKELSLQQSPASIAGQVLALYALHLLMARNWHRIALVPKSTLSKESR